MKPEWASRITVINEDAAKVTYPETPLVVFLFSPFFAPVLRRVLANLERQLRRAPRETYLLYANNPRFTKVLKRFPVSTGGFRDELPADSGEGCGRSQLRYGNQRDSVLGRPDPLREVSETKLSAVRRGFSGGLLRSRGGEVHAV